MILILGLFLGRIFFRPVGLVEPIVTIQPNLNIFWIFFFFAKKELIFRNIFIYLCYDIMKKK